MTDRIDRWDAVNVRIDASRITGLLELRRHSLGHGGVNPFPLPPRVVDGVKKLRPPLVRIFIQEFFKPLTDGCYDWSALDAYMDSFAATGAKVVAAICLKPAEIFPMAAIDQRIWHPADVGCWQAFIGELVRRYSVERDLVTHWEIGNEVDIGENGGCPYMIPDPADYHTYYEMTIAPILKIFPAARVGGPAAASVDSPVMAGFIRLCAERGTQLDFVSHHIYSDSPAAHAERVVKARRCLRDNGIEAEVFVTEFSPMFEKYSTAEQAFECRRAGCVAAAVLAMLEAGCDGSFHYHIWDQLCQAEDFESFFSDPVGIMVRHWNEIPHRFGLFGVNGRVRPQYFVYQMLAKMGAQRLATESDDADVRVLAAADDSRPGELEVMLVNFGEAEPRDRVAKLQLTGIMPGLAELRLLRVDDRHNWDECTLEMVPVEIRDTWTAEHFEYHVALPAGSVAMFGMRRSGAEESS